MYSNHGDDKFMKTFFVIMVCLGVFIAYTTVYDQSSRANKRSFTYKPLTREDLNGIIGNRTF